MGRTNYEVIYRAKFQATYHRIGYDSIVDVLRLGYFHCFDYLQEEGIWVSLFRDQELPIGTNIINLYDSNIDIYLNKDFLDYRVQVIEGSPAYYQYRLTGLRHMRAQYSDFWNPMEPIIMFSNIENGYGIFAGFQSKIYKIDLK